LDADHQSLMTPGHERSAAAETGYDALHLGGLGIELLDEPAPQIEG
jgi:hypothetical protein